MKSFVNVSWENLFSTYCVLGPVLIPLGWEYLNNLINIMAHKYLYWDSTLGIIKVHFFHFNVYSQVWELADIVWESNSVYIINTNYNKNWKPFAQNTSFLKSVFL